MINVSRIQWTKKFNSYLSLLFQTNILQFYYVYLYDSTDENRISSNHNDDKKKFDVNRFSMFLCNGFPPPTHYFFFICLNEFLINLWREKKTRFYFHEWVWWNSDVMDWYWSFSFFFHLKLVAIFFSFSHFSMLLFR